MAQTGKKINELTAITAVSNETVLPAVYVSGGNASSTANKVSIEQISNKITNDLSTILNSKQDKLTAGDNITIENNVISAEVPSLPEDIYTEENLVAGNGITLTKEDNVTTITATAQVPDNVWTQDNLVAGNNISITQVQQPVIDEHTTALWHFDGNVNNEISDSDYAISADWSKSYIDTSDHSGFEKALKCPGEGYPFLTTNYKDFSANGMTSDFWIYSNNSASDQTIRLCQFSQKQPFFLYVGNNQIKIRTLASGNYTDCYVGSFTINTWYHIAFEVYNNEIIFYINGSKVYVSNDIQSTLSVMDNANGTRTGIYIDELRISNVSRYQGQNFTPFTQPYAAAGGPTQYQINNTKADPDLSSYLQNTATGSNSLTIGGNVSTADGATNIGSLSSAAMGSVAVGAWSKAVSYGTAFGQVAQANGNSSISIGTSSSSSNSAAISIGRNASASGANSLAIGGSESSNVNNTYATQQNAIAIGYGARSTVQSAIQLGLGTNSTANTFQVFNTTVVNANGKIPMTSTDVTSLTGYDDTKTQVLKNINGTLTWVDEA